MTFFQKANADNLDGWRVFYRLCQRNVSAAGGGSSGPASLTTIFHIAELSLRSSGFQWVKTLHLPTVSRAQIEMHQYRRNLSIPIYFHV